MKYHMIFDREKELQGQYLEFLLNLLSKVGINKEECTFTYDLEQEIPSDNSIIVGFGAKVLQKFQGSSEIERRRGSIYSINSRKWIFTFSPSQCSRGGGTSHWYLPALCFDLARAKMEALSTEMAHEPGIEVSSDPDLVDKYLNTVAKSNSLCAFDIETALAGGERIRCIGFSADSNHALVVPTENIPIDQYFSLLEVIKKWMSGTSIRWVGQNAYGFDINYILGQWKFTVGNFVADTMVMHHLLAPEFPHDLGTITSFYTRIPYYKDTSEADLYHYNGLDAVATFIAATEMFKELERRKLMDLYRNYYHKLLTPLREMSLRGIKIDTKYQKELKDALVQEIEKTQEELDAQYASYADTSTLQRKCKQLTLLMDGGRKTYRTKGKRRRISSSINSIKKQIDKQQSLNVRSTKEMQKFLYGTLKLKPIKNKGKITTNELALNKLFISTGHPFLKLMIKLRQVRKSMSDYGMMKTDRDSRVRTTYSFAETGRLRSGRFHAK